jgi:hypothetical protein
MLLTLSTIMWHGIEKCQNDVTCERLNSLSGRGLRLRSMLSHNEAMSQAWVKLYNNTLERTGQIPLLRC